VRRNAFIVQYLIIFRKEVTFMNKKASAVALIFVLVAAVGLVVMLNGASTTGMVAKSQLVGRPMPVQASQAAQCLRACKSKCMQVAPELVAECFQRCQGKCLSRFPR